MRGRGEGRHPAPCQGPRDGADQHRAAGGRCGRGDHHRSRRRGHRHDHRFGRFAQGSAGQPGQHLQDRHGQGPGRGNRVRDPLDRHRGCGCGREHRGSAPGRPGQRRQAGAQAEAEKRPRWPRRKSRRTGRRSSLAEAEVPKAMAEAFRKGHLGIMDYYRMRNVQADTNMRDSIAAPGEAVPSPPREKRSPPQEDTDADVVTGAASSVAVFLLLPLLNFLLTLWRRRRRESAPDGPCRARRAADPAQESRPRSVQAAQVTSAAIARAGRLRRVLAEAPPRAARLKVSARLGPPDARRGVVLMAILGPCRALEPGQPSVIEARDPAAPSSCPSPAALGRATTPGASGHRRPKPVRGPIIPAVLHGAQALGRD